MRRRCELTWWTAYIHSVRERQRQRENTCGPLWGLGANRCGSLESVNPFGPIAPSQHAAVKSVHWKLCPPTQNLLWRKLQKTKKQNTILACNDHHLVHHFITICSSLLTKGLLGWWYLVVVDGWLGCRLDVVLPLTPSPQWCFTLSGSLLGPALRLQLHEVAPRCWSQLSFL